MKTSDFEEYLIFVNRVEILVRTGLLTPFNRKEMFPHLETIAEKVRMEEREREQQLTIM